MAWRVIITKPVFTDKHKIIVLPDELVLSLTSPSVVAQYIVTASTANQAKVELLAWLCGAELRIPPVKVEPEETG